MTDNKNKPTEKVYETKPLDPNIKIYRQKLTETITEQPALLDSLAKQLITIELATPALYAAILKLTKGADASIGITGNLIGTFICWFIALACTCYTLYPRTYNVDDTALHKVYKNSNDTLGIEDFFTVVADHKRRWLFLSMLAYWLGLIFGLFILFS